ncbi:MAG: Late embryosis abundant protein [Candidatus Acidoferrum typicum]|jgi:ElaB/YqjD/DUF883 family membrane-anchored ribosome-binding protein|nr:Late embryosis abundant protein [Candidatus Acidoferrum typicum]
MDDYNKQSGQSTNYGESTGTGAAGTAARMKEEVAEKTTDIKEKVSDFGRKAVEKIDYSRQSAADALDQTASSLHSGGDKLSGAAHSAANSLEATAEYVRQTDVKGMAADVGEFVKRYPGPALAAAAIFGFLVARGLSSSND